MHYFKLFVITVFVACMFPCSVSAQFSPLPLAVGNSWKLRSVTNIEMNFTVMDQSSRGARVRWQNPWIPTLDFYFTPSGNQVLLTAMNSGEGLWDLPSATVYFDFGAAVNHTWANMLGTFTLVSKTMTVVTPVGTYTNCVHIRLLTPEEVVFDWVLAPGVGFVQFGLGTSAYRLAAAPTLVIPKAETAPPATPVARGNRVLGLDVNPAADGNYENAIALAKRAGAQTVSLTIHWEDIEVAPGVYRPQENLLAIANAFYPPHGLQVDLFLVTMDPMGKHVPADLRNLPMNDSRVITRFKLFLNYVFTQIPNLKCNFLVLGSEIDLGLDTNTTQWSQYEAFVKAARSHIVLRKPGLKVGVSATFQALTGVYRPQLQRMNPDGVFVSYYPLRSTFAVQEPTAVATDFQRLISLHPGKLIYVEQIGYPSSAVVESSEVKQRDFYIEVFKTWDRYASTIRSITFTWLHDISTSQADEFSLYYGVPLPEFSAMLGSLGLRTYAGAGEDKAAFVALQEEARKRGW